MKEEILKLLRESEAFISGEEMCQKLNVSRTAVWKHIKKLKEEGYTILSATNKGYKLTFVPDHYHSEELNDLLKDNKLVEKVFVSATIDSTNMEAKRAAMQGDVRTALFVSDEQTLGIGRRGRTWVSKQGTGIFMSLLLRPKIKPVHASMLTLIAGIAVNDAIREVTQLKCQIKWPNDLVLNSKKICGILTEMNSEIDEINYVVVGIGINVNNTNFDESINQIATSLSKESGKTYIRQEIIVQILNNFEKLYVTFLEEASLNFILEAYNEACINVGRTVKLEMGGQSIVGESLRVTEMGELVVRTLAGEELVVHSGEVSVRGLYGYID